MPDIVKPAEVNKYLLKYASEKWKPEWDCSALITTIIVVPAIKEYNNIPKLLTSLINNEREYFPETLILFVINNINSSEQEIKNDNSLSLQILRDIINKKYGIDNLTDDIINSGIRIGIIDAASEGFEMPEKDGGVGYARKIGMDIALTLFNYSLPKKKIIVCLDADCVVNNNYLSEIIKSFNESKLSAAVIYFEHAIPDGNINSEAIICYEIFLRYYVLAMRFAGSPYAFHSIGSTIACDYESYIKVEGMSKRKAAEDFYFLEKLAKLVKIAFINTTTVYPSARGSWRVPFGTGQRINRFISKVRDEYRLYDPQSFIILKNWLNLFYLNEYSEPAEYMEKAKQIHPELFNFLKQQKFEQDWKKIQTNSRSEAQLNKQKSQWFDSFRTMKLIHFLRDIIYPEINMFTAADTLLSLYGLTPLNKAVDGQIPPVNVQKEYLQTLRELDKIHSI